MLESVATARLLIVDDNMNALKALEYVLDREGFHVDCAASGLIALNRLKKQSYDVVISDLKMPGLDGLELLESIRANHPDVAVLILTAHATVDNAVRAVRRGANDYLQKPFQPTEIIDKVHAALAERGGAEPSPAQLVELPVAKDDYPMIGVSEAMKEVDAYINKVATKDIAVAIYGESGTGKELVARALHRRSERSDKPFVAVNCASIPETLLENELFGHVKGAYTGANATQRGLFEEANGGTMLLDEIGDIPIAIQAKLLRVLQEQEFRKIGGTKDIKVDVRVISATNRDLREAVQDGTFREDLYYRINVVPIRLPPLRDRPEDIPVLANHFRTLFNAELSLKIKKFCDDAMVHMINSPWPGNIRELKNRVKMGMVMASDDILTAESLGFGEATDKRPFPRYRDAKESFERDYILKALKMCGGNVKKAAKIAGRDRSTFYDLLNKYEITADSFRDLF